MPTNGIVPLTQKVVEPQLSEPSEQSSFHLSHNKFAAFKSKHKTVGDIEGVDTTEMLKVLEQQSKMMYLW